MATVCGLLLAAGCVRGPGRAGGADQRLPGRRPRPSSEGHGLGRPDALILHTAGRRPPTRCSRWVIGRVRPSLGSQMCAR